MLAKVYVDKAGKCRCKTCEKELTIDRNVYAEFEGLKDFEDDSNMNLYPDGALYVSVVCPVCNYELFSFLPFEQLQECLIVEEEEGDPLCQEQF